MKKMNWNRVLSGGLAAGFVMNVLDFLTNAVWLGPEWASAMSARNLDPVALHAATGIGWVCFDFLCGFVLVWLYAAIRPRFGPGPQTAFLAAFVLWLVVHAVLASYVFMGYAAFSLVARAGVAELASALIGGWVGGYLYKEG